jgi:hypothetical protein
MTSSRRLDLHWGLLLVVSWALLVPTALVALFSGMNVLTSLSLLFGGIPLYFLAANLIVGRCGGWPAESASADDAFGGWKVQRLPDHETSVGDSRKTENRPRLHHLG